MLAAQGPTRVYTVRGQVLSPAGVPVAGAKVRLTLHDYNALRADSELAESFAWTADNGRFIVVFDLGLIERGSRSQARWLLTVEAPGMARYSEGLPRTYSQNRTGGVEELGGLLLARGRTVTGRVVLETPGRASDRVSLWPADFETIEPWVGEVGTDGRFEVTMLPEGSYLLLVERDGEPALFGGEHAISGRGGLGSKRGEALVHDLGTVRVGAPRVLGGRVVDSRGEPLPGIEMTLDPRIDRQLPENRLAVRAVSDERGFFRLPLDRAAVGYGLTARGKGHRRLYAYYEVGADAGDRLDVPASLALEPEALLAGWIVDETGRGIAEAKLYAREHDDDMGTLVVAGPDGRFSFDDLPAAEYRIDVLAPGFRTRTVDGRSTTGDPPAAELLVVLDRLDTFDLEILVRGPDAAPVPGVSVELWKEGGAEPHFSDMSETDADGHTQVPYVPAGYTYALRTRHPDHPDLERHGLVLGADDGVLELELERPSWESVELEGRVLAINGSPRPGARVALEPLRHGARREVSSDEEGRFRLSRVRAGAYRLLVTARGSALSRRQLVVTGATAPLEIQLGPGASVEGEIRGLDSSQLSRVQIRADAKGVLESLEARIEGPRYRIDGVGTGEWWVRASLGGASLEEKVWVEPDLETVIRSLDFPPFYQVRCYVTLDHRPVGSGTVRLDGGPDAGNWHGGAIEEEEPGVLIFSDVAAGSYHLNYHGPGGGARRPVSVDSDLDLHLDLRTGAVEGRVVDAETGHGLAGLAIEAGGEVIVSHTNYRFETVTDATGRFRLGPMVEGPWHILVRDGREVLARDFLTIRRESTAKATLRVDARKGLRVRVETESGRIPNMVELTLRNEDGVFVGHGAARLNEAAAGWWRDAPEGRWQLLASDGYGRVSIPVEIPGEPVTLRFPLAGSLRLEVPTLLIEADVGAKIDLEFQGEGRTGRAVTRRGALTATGRRFLVLGLQPGFWSATVTAEDGRVWMGQIDVRHDQHHDLVLTR